MEPAENEQTLRIMPLGGRLLVRSRKDWRFASVCRIADGAITLSVCSPGGRTYRLRRTAEAAIDLDGPIPILKPDTRENWRANLCFYERRW